MNPLISRRSMLQLLALAPLGGTAVLRTNKPEWLTFYAGTYTDGESQGIYHCRMDLRTGALETHGATGGIANPSFLAIDPSRTHLYAVSETMEFDGKDGGGLFAYAIDPADGTLQALNSRPTHGGAPCYVSVTPDGRHVLVANYMGGNVASYPIEADGRLGGAADIEQHEGSSIHPRQEAPHAHFIAPDPEGRHALAVDLGIDGVVIYRVDDGDLVPAGQAPLAPGAGPRHLAFHPRGDLAFVINELDSTVTAFSYADGVLDPHQSVTTLPEAFSGENFCADIHVSADGRFVYGSNRGHDSIVVYAVDPQSGGLTPIQHVSTGGSWPRNFAIDPTGRFLVAANQRSGNIVVFAVDQRTGVLAPAGHELVIPSPVCIRFAV